MIISHVKIIAFQTITNHSFWTFYIGGKPVVYILMNRKIHGCLEISDLFLVEINLSGISAHPSMYYSLYIKIISFDHYNFMETQRKFSNVAISKAFVRSLESL